MLVGHAQVHAVRPTQPAPKRQNRPPTALTRQARTGPHNTHVRLKTRTGSSGKKAATAKDPWPLRGSGRSAKHPASAHAFKQARGQGRTRPNSPVTWASMLRQDNTHSHSPPPPARAPHPHHQAARGPPACGDSASCASSVPTSLLPVRKYLRTARPAGRQALMSRALAHAAKQTLFARQCATERT